MAVFLIRHAKAGSRFDWDGPDPLRPLSRKGRAQAEELVALLGGEAVERVVSSPYLRCLQTVEPLAAKFGVAVERHRALVEGASTTAALKLVRALAAGGAVLCSHGDVIPAVLDGLAFTDGLPLPDDFAFAKGSTWVLESVGGRFVSARYLPPP